MHKPNFKPNTIFCRDNLLILQKMNSECVDLIYADPPFNKRKEFTAPIGSSAAGAGFKDYFEMSDLKESWILALQEDNPKLHSLLRGIRGAGRNEYNYAYLVYMAMRLIECRRILKTTGSMYLHCDHTMAHYLKLVMDVIFGEQNFRNEIAWCYSGGGVPRVGFGRKHDTLLFYSKTCRAPEITTFNRQHRPYAESSRQMGKRKDGSPLNPAGAAMDDWWTDIKPLSSVRKTSDEYVDYPTQKPLALLKRVINASSNPGDLVLDPFCGCATACVAAQGLQRKWVGIDVGERAWSLVKKRIKKHVPAELQDEKYNFQVDAPTLTHAHSQHSKYIYVISCGSFSGKYKVGHATDPQKRLNSYQTASPARDYEIVFSVKTEYYAEIEARIHMDFNADHEWVTGDLQKIIAKIEYYLANPDEFQSRGNTG